MTTVKNNNKSSRRISFDYKFRLYIAGDAPNSNIAKFNLDDIASNLLEDKCEIEIIDVLKNPERALIDQILVTPTLIRLFPLPEKRIIGNLNEKETVIHTLGL